MTYDTIEKLENKFSIFNEEEFIGMIQEVRIEEDNIHIGRFVLNPQKTGLGFGTEALKEFIISLYTFHTYSLKNHIYQSFCAFPCLASWQ